MVFINDINIMGAALKSILLQMLVPFWATGGGLMLIDDKFLHGLIKQQLKIDGVFEWFYYIVLGGIVVINLASRALKLRREWLQQREDFKDLD
jgi:hypothetical protein